jgi:hypothetical protein
MIRPDKWYRIGWDGAGAPGGASPKARARRGERRTWRRAAAPLDGELVTALTALRKRQLDESTAAGTAYRSGLARLD